MAEKGRRSGVAAVSVSEAFEHHSPVLFGPRVYDKLISFLLCKFLAG